MLGYFLFAFLFLLSFLFVFDKVQGALLFNMKFAKALEVRQFWTVGLGRGRGLPCLGCTLQTCSAVGLKLLRLRPACSRATHSAAATALPPRRSLPHPLWPPTPPHPAPAALAPAGGQLPHLVRGPRLGAIQENAQGGGEGQGRGRSRASAAQRQGREGAQQGTCGVAAGQGWLTALVSCADQGCDHGSCSPDAT